MLLLRSTRKNLEELEVAVNNVIETKLRTKYSRTSEEKA